MQNFNIQQQLEKIRNKSLSGAQSATIIKNNQKEKEKEKEKETFDLPANGKVTSFSSWPASQNTENSYVADATDRCAMPRILTKGPHHRTVALQKSDLLKNISQSDVKYARVSIYRFADDLENSTDVERMRVNLSIKFQEHLEMQYADLLDQNGFCKFVFKCSDRIRELKRGNQEPYASWSGYDVMRDFCMAHPSKYAGKGAFVGKKGSKRVTPPPAYYTAIGIVSEDTVLYNQPYAKVIVGNFTTEVELYKDNSHMFAYQGEYNANQITE